MQPRIVPKYAAGKRPWDILRVFSEYFGDVVGSVFELFLGVLLGYRGCCWMLLSYCWESYWDILGIISGIWSICVVNCANYTVGSINP